MKIGGEEVELVTDFATLRAGMRAIEMPCRYCGGVHRHWLGNPGVGETMDATGADLGPTRYFEILSTDDCNRNLDPVLSERMVKKRIVYRAVDPKLDAEPVERERELVRSC